MSAKMSLLIICVEVIIYLSLNNLRDCTINIYIFLSRKRLANNLNYDTLINRVNEVI